MRLLFILLLLASAFASLCYRPPVVSCDAAQEIIDCMYEEGEWSGHIRTVMVSLIYDFMIWLKPGEHCSLDLKGAGYMANYRVFHIAGGEGSSIKLFNGTILPAAETAPYGIYVGPGVDRVTLEHITIFGFKSALGGAHGLSLYGDHELYTNNVYIVDNGIGIATNGFLYWEGVKSYVWANAIGVEAPYFGGNGHYSTWICQNVIDVDVDQVVDLAARTFKADVIVPWLWTLDYSDLFDSCRGFVPPWQPPGEDDGGCVEPPWARAKVRLLGEELTCVVSESETFTLPYEILLYQKGQYTLYHISGIGETILDAGYVEGYIEKQDSVTLEPGVNFFTLQGTAYASNECGETSASSMAMACVLYQPEDCTSETEEVRFNGEVMGDQGEFTVYMHSPAYLDVVGRFSGDFEECVLYLDGMPVATTTTNLLDTQLVFTQEGDHILALTCYPNHCNPEMFIVHVRKADDTCDNEVDILNLEEGACRVIKNTSSYNAQVYAYSENTTSTLNLYLNGELVSSTSVSGSTTLTVPFPTSPGQYTLYAEVIGEGCFDSDFGCLIVEPEEEECEISLSASLPTGKVHTNESYLAQYFGFDAYSNYPMSCSLTLNGSSVYESSGTTVSFGESYYLSPGTYHSQVVCVAAEGCSAQYVGELEIISTQNISPPPNATPCTFSMTAQLPGGHTNETTHEVIWNARAEGPVACAAYLNQTLFSTSPSYASNITLEPGVYSWQVYCYEVANPSCYGSYLSWLNITSDQSPLPEMCYLYLNAELPSGTYENNTTQILWYSASSNYPMTCELYLNDSLLYQEANVFQSSYFSNQTYGIGSYLFELICKADQCEEKRVSSLYVVNGTITAGSCNITLRGELPSGTYNGSWEGDLWLEVISLYPVQCNLTLNNTLLATFNESYNTHLSLGEGSYLFAAVCADSQGCVESMASSLYVTTANTTLPPNITCAAEVSFRDLPDQSCEVVSDQDYLLYYRGYLSHNGTVRVYHNEELIEEKSFEGYFKGTAGVTLVPGTNVFMVKAFTGPCVAVDSGCVYYSNYTPEVCEVGVESFGELEGESFTYHVVVYNQSECMVFKDGEVIDRFNTSGYLTKTYTFNISSPTLFKITCAQEGCVNSSQIEVSPSCKAYASVWPQSCEPTSQISYQIYSNYPYNYTLAIGDMVLEQAGGGGLLEKVVYLNLSPGIYPLHLTVEGVCDAQAHGCVMVPEARCEQGLNLTLKEDYYRVEGEKGECYLYVDGLLVDVIPYEGIVEGRIEGSWKQLTLACEDILYCEKKASLKRSLLKVSLLTNETGLKLTPENNSTFIYYSLEGEPALCRAYLEGEQVYEEEVSPGVHSFKLEFSRPGLYGLAMECESEEDKATTYQELLVYYITTNDTTPPNILLIYPPNNSIWSRFPSRFIFLPVDDLDWDLDCKLYVYDKEGELVFTKKGSFPMGTYARVSSPYSHRLHEGELYYWNVSCVDDGDPVGYSETWVFGGTDQEINQSTTNFIYPNQTQYYNQSVKLYYGVNSTLPSVNSSVYLNNLPIIPWTNLSSNTLYATIVELPPGEYEVAIISYVDESYIVNRTSFVVLAENETVPEIVPNVTIDNETNTTISFNVTNTTEEHVNASIYIDQQEIYQGIITTNFTYIFTAILPDGNHTVEINVTDGENASTSISFETFTGAEEEIIYFAYINLTNTTFYTSNVSFNYGIISNSSLNGSLYLNHTLLLNLTLEPNTTYNLSLTLDPGHYVIGLVTPKGEFYQAFTVVGIKEEKEAKILPPDEKVLAQLYPVAITRTATPLFFTPATAIIGGAIVLAAALLWLLWRKRTVVIELLEEPYVGLPVTLIVREKSGGPVKGAMLVVIDEAGNEYTLITDHNGVATFIPKVRGEHIIKPVKFKPAPGSVTSFTVK